VKTVAYPHPIAPGQADMQCDIASSISFVPLKVLLAVCCTCRTRAGPGANSQGQRKKDNPERFTLLNRVPFGKFNRVNSEPVNAYPYPEPVRGKFSGIKNSIILKDN